MKNKVLIVNGGSCSEALLEDVFRSFCPQVVIAVDGALALFYRIGLRPTHIVGDFDTISPEILEHYGSDSYHIERHIPEKDETDSELAMNLALSLWPAEICVLGATGYRMDHAMANLANLMLPFSRGIPCRIVDEWNEISLVGQKAVFSLDEHRHYISFLPFTDEVTGITLKGFLYPLENHTMKKGIQPGLGVSNEIVDAQASITTTSGILLCIRSSDGRRGKEQP